MPQELLQVPTPRCIHLQSKAMAVYGEGYESDPDFQDGMTTFWCMQTGRPLGPDNGEVGMNPCSDQDRGCYQEY
jgi:hypothetical protein